MSNLETKSLDNMLADALQDAADIQKKQNSKEISMCITYIENAQDKVNRLKNIES